jgi:methionine synthase II (cobalamin-independent)
MCIDHHTLQVERPDHIADLICEALKYIPPRAADHLVGMRHRGASMSRRHVAYKMVAMVPGTNIV